mmetsp:Transcript_9653/g.18825  ORF Transcript_9653/g.18825 Transcript_9653/m.18825 type:complete len:138 (-) Transcript_9653:4192-4605(-)
MSEGFEICFVSKKKSRVVEIEVPTPSIETPAQVGDDSIKIQEIKPLSLVKPSAHEEVRYVQTFETLAEFGRADLSNLSIIELKQQPEGEDIVEKLNGEFMWAKVGGRVVCWREKTVRLESRHQASAAFIVGGKRVNI